MIETTLAIADKKQFLLLFTTSNQKNSFLYSCEKILLLSLQGNYASGNFPTLTTYHQAKKKHFQLLTG
jgi:hypothetical protein